jgi:ABC-2 type transport system permease protein
MTGQIRAILWAQFRTARNHLPRTTWGAALLWLLSLVWYGMFAGIALALATGLPQVRAANLLSVVSAILLGLLAFWQIFPLMTLNSGWSLDVRRLLVYPISDRTLFAVETLLRITSALESLILLAGMIIGLESHPGVPKLAPWFLLFYVPLNLFLSLAIRESLLRLLGRRRFKELFAIVFLCIVLLPSLLANTSLGTRLTPLAAKLAARSGTPWFELSSLALGHLSWLALILLPLWILAAYWFSLWQFTNGLGRDRSAFEASAAPLTAPGRQSLTAPLFNTITALFSDPTAALIEKEFRILLRSPRFRVLFGMACVFSVIVFLPFSSGRLSSHALSQNYLPAVSAYGLVLLGEALLWNAFGFDRKAAQLYFVAPVPLSTVVRAKNAVAVVFVLLMTLLISGVGLLFRQHVTLLSTVGSIALTAVLTVFFLAFGNLTSVLLPRPVDPNQTMRKQSSGQLSLWFLLVLVVLAVPVGLAFAARWAFDSEWAFFTVLGVDFLIGVIVYYVATESAIVRAEHNRERMLDALAKGADPIES